MRELLGDTGVDASVLGAAAFLEGALLARGSRPYFRYVGEERDLIHNANLLACSVLVRAARVLDEPGLAAAAVAPLHTTLDAQAPDGSWPYSERRHGAWVDNFHTGYVLESLAACAGLAPAVVPGLERGIDFWERALFHPDGTPRGTTAASLPVDSHSYAQAVETWLAVAPWRPDAVDRAERVARLLVERMLAPDGHVYFEQRRFWTSRVPFVRWTTAASFRALSRLLLVRTGIGQPREVTGARLG